jgi:TonB family protein
VSGWWGRFGEPPPGTQLGAIEVLVDEHGRVAEARVYLSVNRVYDAVLLESVKSWRFQPATRAGRPVKYRRITGVVSGR